MQVRISVILALFFLSAGCTKVPPPPLRIGTCIRIGCEPFFLARDLGYFDHAPIKLVEYTSSSDILRAIRNNAVGGGAISLDEALLLSHNIPTLRIVLVLSYSNGTDAIVAKPKLKSLKNLKDKRIGLENTPVAFYILNRALENAGLQRDELKLTTIAIDQQLRAYQENRVDALVTYDPVRARLLNSGARLLFDSSQLPGEIIEVLAVRQEYIDNEPEAVQRLVTSWFLATKFLHEARTDAVQRMAIDRNTNPKLLSEMLSRLTFPGAEENRQLLSDRPPALIKTEERIGVFLKEQGFLTNPPNLRTLPDGEFVRKLTVTP